MQNPSQKEHDMTIRELDAATLYHRCKPEFLGFETTDDLDAPT